jgi:predicted component of type VI protein secretion system
VPRHRSVTTVYLERQEVIVGRRDPDTSWYPAIDLSAADPARHVSRRHLTLERSGTQFNVTAHRAVNGTRLDGLPLAPEQPEPITAGSRLELGDLVATLLLRPVLDPTPVAGDNS